jgi:hypothetical protein
LKYWKAAVIFNIDILHFTEGGTMGTPGWNRQFQWHNTFSKQLPPDYCKGVHPKPGGKRNRQILAQTIVDRKNFLEK